MATLPVIELRCVFSCNFHIVAGLIAEILLVLFFVCNAVQRSGMSTWLSDNDDFFIMSGNTTIIVLSDNILMTKTCYHPWQQCKR